MWRVIPITLLAFCALCQGQYGPLSNEGLMMAPQVSMDPGMGMPPLVDQAPAMAPESPAYGQKIPLGKVHMLAEPASCPSVSSYSVSPGGRRLQQAPTNHTIKLSSQNVHWGYYFSALNPAAVVSSGDEIVVETATHQAGDDYDKMVRGDPAMEEVYLWTQTSINVAMRGRSGKGDGVHVLTGPIYVCGAQPGDVLQVDILDIEPRINPRLGKTYGTNAAASWGYQFRAGFLDGVKREVITIYEIIRDSANNLLWAVPDYQYKYNAPKAGYVGPVTNCTVDNSVMPGAANGIDYHWNNTQRAYRKGNKVPCINNTQTWGGYWYPGLIVTHPTGTEDYSIRGKFRVPINFHIGNMGVASAYNDTVDSVPPAIHGGNVDDRRIGKGATMYYPVQVNGGLLSLGDCHTSQGDSEFDGTAIETSVTVRLRVTLHKAAAMPKILQGLKFPLLENANEYVVHGFTYNNYLQELENPFVAIYNKSTLDRTFTVAYNNTRDFIMNGFNLTEDQAITAITVAMDFGVDQVVDGNWGVHCIIPKWMFNMTDNSQYAPKVFYGTSKPANVTLLTSL